MSIEKPMPDLTCWDCGVTNHPDASECWLCQRQDWRKFPGSQPRQTTSPPPRGPHSSIANWMVLIAMVAVVTGVFRSAPGLSLVVLISVLPALIVTEIRASRRRRRNLPMSGMEKALWIMGLTILIPVLLMIALVIALFTYCMLMSR
jgi:hypothetical protein